MHLSSICFVRTVSREALKKTYVFPTLPRHIPRSQHPTLLDKLEGQTLPPNLRLEKEVQKSTLQHVPHKKRMKLLKLKKEK